MSEVTWLMVLGAIAILTPIVILTLNDYVGEPTIDLATKIREEYGLYFNQTEYDIIQNMTCANIFEENDLGIVNYDLLHDNRYIYFLPENNWVWSLDIRLTCYFNDDYVENKINQTLLNQTEVESYFQEEIEAETDEGKTRSFINRMNPDRFFEAINEFPESIKYFIYTFYTLFFGYLVVRAVTLL